MSKTAFLFPGQGAQYVGMGKDFYDTMPTAKKVFDCAANVTELPIDEICFTENEEINETKYTQIAMLTTEVAILKCMEEAGMRAGAYAGLSLGEYAAVVASKAMDMEDAFKLVKKRGLWMQEAYPQGGAMSAVLSLDAGKIEEICKETEGIVSIANYNCPGQIVITGEAEAVAKASEKMKEAGAAKCIPLKVSGPFHSVFMESVSLKLEQELNSIELKEIEVPYACNVTGEFVTDSKEIAPLLSKQVAQSVKFEQSIRNMIEQGFDTFVEVGPGKTLTSFLRKISRDVTVYRVGSVEEFEEVKAKLL